MGLICKHSFHRELTKGKHYKIEGWKAKNLGSSQPIIINDENKLKSYNTKYFEVDSFINKDINNELQIPCSKL